MDNQIIKNRLREKFSKYKYVHLVALDNNQNYVYKVYNMKDVEIELCVDFIRVYLYSIRFKNNVEPLTNIAYIKLSNREIELLDNLTNSLKEKISIHWVQYDGKDNNSENKAVIYSEDNKFQQFRFDMQVWYSHIDWKNFLEDTNKKVILTCLNKNILPELINYDEISEVTEDDLFLPIRVKTKLLKHFKLKVKNRRYKMLG